MLVLCAVRIGTPRNSLKLKAKRAGFRAVSLGEKALGLWPG